MRHANWVLAVVAMSMPLQSEAYEARVSIGGGSEYISNVFRNQENIQDDFKFGVSPQLKALRTWCLIMPTVTWRGNLMTCSRGHSVLRSSHHGQAGRSCNKKPELLGGSTGSNSGT